MPDDDKGTGKATRVVRPRYVELSVEEAVVLKDGCKGQVNDPDGLAEILHRFVPYMRVNPKF